MSGERRDTDQVVRPRVWRNPSLDSLSAPWYFPNADTQTNTAPEHRLFRYVIIRAIVDYANYRRKMDLGRNLSGSDKIEYEDLCDFLFIDDPEFCTFYTLAEYLFEDSESIRNYIRNWLRTDYFYKSRKIRREAIVCPKQGRP